MRSDTPAERVSEHTALGRISPTRLFYRDEYVYDVLERGPRHAFDVLKPRRIRDTLIAAGVAVPSTFFAAEPLSEAELLAVHTPEYLTQIRRPETLARLLLLDPEHPWDARLLQPFLFASGGTLAAARFAIKRGGIGVNLSGGYHHAQADKAEGFCAIADVAIAIRMLQREARLRRALIVDLDYHHGNGNAEIFANDESVFTLASDEFPQLTIYSVHTIMPEVFALWPTEQEQLERDEEDYFVFRISSERRYMPNPGTYVHWTEAVHDPNRWRNPKQHFDITTHFEICDRRTTLRAVRK